MSTIFDDFTDAARKKLKVDASYHIAMLEGVGPDTLITLMQCDIWGSGPRAGKKKYLKKTSKRVVLTEAEIDAAINARLKTEQKP